MISTRHADIPSIVDHEVTGLLVNERSPAEIAEAIEQLLADRSGREAMGVAGRARIEKHHDIRKSTHRLEAVYDSLL